MKIQVLLLKQDDPKKCTAAKLVRLGIAKPIKKTLVSTLILNPYAHDILLSIDQKLVRTISGIDCSWNLAENRVFKNFLGLHRKLPPLFAGNPINYSKLDKLTTVEALSAALFILGYKEESLNLLDKFKWGHTFYDLNRNLLNDYAKINSVDEIYQTTKEYGISS